jgi:hypothetical protein
MSSKLRKLGLEILEKLSNIPEQTLQVRAAIAKTILMNNALRQIPEQKEEVVEPVQTKKKATRKKKK